jgi:hypothetical protein
VNGWTVELTTSAQREFRQLEDGPQQAAAELIADLAEDPSLVPALEMRVVGYFDFCFLLRKSKQPMSFIKSLLIFRAISVEDASTAFS